MKKQLMISPSGNYYGSEQVLYDYLQFTSLKWVVDVPRNSEFAGICAATPSVHRFRKYTQGHLFLYYAGIFLELCLGRYKAVCINEAGHAKYIFILARIFKSVRFLIHVRLIDDTSENRWISTQLPENLVVVSVSEYIKGKLPVKSTLVYDMYPFSTNETSATRQLPVGRFRVGIIGRVTLTKGVGRLPAICKALSVSGAEDHFEFHLYGEISQDIPATLISELENTGKVFLHGMVADKAAIYGNIDLVLHLNENEALGRIFLESIDYSLPFVGINAAGIGEIGALLDATQGLVALTDELADAIAGKLIEVRADYAQKLSQANRAKEAARKVFSGETYVAVFENALNQ